MLRKSKTNGSHGEPERGSAPSDTAPPDTAPPDTEPSGRREAGDRVAPAVGFNSRGKVRRTRAGEWWAGLIVAAILAIALLIFIAQNSQKATIHYFGFDGQISVAVALLFAAASGVLLVAVPGAVRMAQLRRALKKNAAADKG